MPKTITAAAGGKTVIEAERISYRQGLTIVRAFYLDLSQWAVEDPGRWAQWVAPCPVSQEEISLHKFARRCKARMDARTRERLPVLPVLVRTVDERRKAAAACWRPHGRPRPGPRTAAGQTLARSSGKASTGKIWADTRTAASGGTSAWKTITPSGHGLPSKSCDSRASGSRNSWR